MQWCHSISVTKAKKFSYCMLLRMRDTVVLILEFLVLFVKSIVINQKQLIENH